MLSIMSMAMERSDSDLSMAMSDRDLSTAKEMGDSDAEAGMSATDGDKCSGEWKVLFVISHDMASLGHNELICLLVAFVAQRLLSWCT